MVGVRVTVGVGGWQERYNDTLSKTAFAREAAFSLETANPTRGLVPKVVIVTAPTFVQEDPSADSYPVKTFPARWSSNQEGAGKAMPPRVFEFPPWVVRY